MGLWVMLYLPSLTCVVLQVYFKQYCRKCQKEFNPYRVEDITCHVSPFFCFFLFFFKLAFVKWTNLWCVMTKPEPLFLLDVQQSTLFLRSNTTPRWPQAAPQTGFVRQMQRQAAVLREHVQLQIHRLGDLSSELCPVTHQYMSCEDTFNPTPLYLQMQYTFVSNLSFMPVLCWWNLMVSITHLTM